MIGPICEDVEVANIFEFFRSKLPVEVDAPRDKRGMPAEDLFTAEFQPLLDASLHLPNDVFNVRPTEIGR
ncbi:hypothetical protein D3C78_1966680 [compost metagenome]